MSRAHARPLHFTSLDQRTNPQLIASAVQPFSHLPEVRGGQGAAGESLVMALGAEHFTLRQAGIFKMNITKLTGRVRENKDGIKIVRILK